MLQARAKYHLGQVVHHRIHPFRGVIFDVDPEFANSDEWYDAIPEESRPAKKQPYYHLLAENEESYYIAYVSEQNLVEDTSGVPVGHPDLEGMFGKITDGKYALDFELN
ncbi:heat shock protein HspQ [Halocynthiibacter namhaensis]|uniref:heat shock protein HspQ n=1 Tax=Halocynthiibacter namhaensis TaxID=1290553 RepID=UPI0005790F25|nr:heat shock protein HspQ [Halocynthiibacter namhaensis]